MHALRISPPHPIECDCQSLREDSSGFCEVEAARDGAAAELVRGVLALELVVVGRVRLDPGAGAVLLDVAVDLLERGRVLLLGRLGELGGVRGVREGEEVGVVEGLQSTSAWSTI